MNRNSPSIAAAPKGSKGPPAPASPANRAFPRASTEAKLALSEFFLPCDDIVQCAERSLEWLGEYVGVDQSLCLAVDPARKRLIGLAACGLPHADVQGISVEIEERQHPFVAAL